MQQKRIDGKGKLDEVTHDEIAEACVMLESELQELGIEVIRRYSFRTYAEINGSMANAHYAVRLKFRVRLFGQERVIMTKYPRHSWRDLWRDGKNVNHKTTLDYYKSVEREMLR